VKKSAKDWPRNVVVDTGPLVAAIDADDPDHVWAVKAFKTLTGTFFTCEACITEAIHLLENSAPAVSRLAKLVDRMKVVNFSDGTWRGAMEEVVRWTPAMDYADACVVLMVSRKRNSFALTTDFNDFAAYRVPFASPQGAFYQAE
jgi:predicted nucleic acid-binding protein